MPTKPKPATEKEPFEGNRIPARFEVELSDRECQLHISPETVKKYDQKCPSTHKEFVCCLTHTAFKVPYGGIVYVLRTESDDHTFDPHYLAPEAVARGLGFIRERVRAHALRLRSNLRYDMERIALMERGAELEIVYDLPELRFL